MIGRQRRQTSESLRFSVFFDIPARPAALSRKANRPVPNRPRGKLALSATRWVRLA